ncbi:MAG TPA: hypothetical protein VKA49_06010 [Flavitalea sp.]|nr:hypothetical protein [Flavitalea sp.]
MYSSFEWLRIKYLIILFFFSSVQMANGQKTDKVFLYNGDILTGEIKSLNLAMLKFDMDGPGIIEIKWEKVIAIRSDRQFEIGLQSGELLVSHLDSAFFSEHSIDVNEIVEMYPIKKKFIRRFSGNISTGVNYTKSSDILEFNFSGVITYRIPKLELSLVTNSFITSPSGDSSLTKEQDIRVNNIFYFGKLLLAGGAIEWQQNTELGIKNRFSIKAYGGKVLIVDNHNRLVSYAGLSLNREQSITTEKYTTNLELPIGTTYRRFFYSFPKQSIDALVNVYPSLSDWGRVRLEFSLKTSVEIFRDFNTGVTFYDKFDNRPPEGAVSKNDFGIALTVSYKFNN